MLAVLRLLTILRLLAVLRVRVRLLLLRRAVLWLRAVLLLLLAELLLAGGTTQQVVCHLSRALRNTALLSKHSQSVPILVDGQVFDCHFLP